MQGAIESLVDRSVQLMKRVKGREEYTLIGGILRFKSMATAVRNHLQTDVNVPSPDTVQFVAAHGAAILGLRRLEKLGTEGISRAADVA